jgi:molybdopterin converting factor small subunit
MQITVQIPSSLRPRCGGAVELRVTADTVRGALEEIRRGYPDLYNSVCNETGAVRQHMNLFINSSLLGDKKQLDVSLESGDVLFIFTAVSGG